MANPGPASNVTANTQVVTAAQSYTINTSTQVGQNMLRLLGSARGVSVGLTGDAVTIPITYVGTYSVATVIVTNSLLAGVSGSSLQRRWASFRSVPQVVRQSLPMLR
jgi:hypothetical protein